MTLSKIERIDKFGHCCYCSAYLLEKRVVDGKVVDMFTPNYSDTTFILDNGSQMQITICKSCKESIDLNDPIVHKEIMNAVFKGWELETINLVEDDKQPDWTEEKRKNYLNNMSKLSIFCNSEKLDKYSIQNKVIEIRKMKIENVKEDQLEVIK